MEVRSHAVPALRHYDMLQHLPGPRWRETDHNVQLPDCKFSVSAQLSGEAESSRGLVELTQTEELELSRKPILGQGSKMSAWASKLGERELKQNGLIN